jgi:hypothetical protein
MSSQEYDQFETVEYHPQEEEFEASAPPPPPRSRVRQFANRAGCCLIFVLWLGVMAIPIFFVVMLVQKEVVISRSDLPEHEFRIFLLEEPRQRGFGLEQGDIVSGGEEEGLYCVKTHVDYFLWEGEGEDVAYCECFEKLGDTWAQTLLGDENCQPFAFTNP